MHTLAPGIHSGFWQQVGRGLCADCLCLLAVLLGVLNNERGYTPIYLLNGCHRKKDFKEGKKSSHN